MNNLRDLKEFILGDSVATTSATTWVITQRLTLGLALMASIAGVNQASVFLSFGAGLDMLTF